MKLLTLGGAGSSGRLAIRTDQGVLDVSVATAALGARAPATMEELLGDYDRGRAELHAIELSAARTGLPIVPEAAVTVLAPVPRPGKIIAIGLNYHAHATECNLPIPDTPVVFAKFANAVVGPGAPIAPPADDPKLDYEAELGFVIGRRARRVSASAALGYVAGYVNANDVSARGLQFRSSQWMLGKTSDGFCPTGPYLVTSDEIPDPSTLTVRCEVNGTVRQTGRTADMIFPCDVLIEYLSRYITLEPGDLVITGTPPGVAVARPDTPWLVPGDVVAVEITGLGRLENPIVAADPQ